LSRTPPLPLPPIPPQLDAQGVLLFVEEQLRGAACGEAAVDEGGGEGVGELAEDDALEGAGAEGGFVAALDEVSGGFGGDAETHFAGGEALFEATNLFVEDEAEERLSERAEDEHVVEA